MLDNDTFLFYSSTDNRVCAGIKRLMDIGMQPAHPGMGALDMNLAEDGVVAGTNEVVPGMIFCGMEVCPFCTCLLQAIAERDALL